MWSSLPLSQRERYKKLISNFASLSEAFAQKTDDDDTIVAPIVNSKFQETAFQRCFNAYAEDIANTSYDASINANNKKYLVGIKTFGIKSSDQKIAQFKSISGSPEWASLIDLMQEQVKGITDCAEINRINHDLYLDLAQKIARVRNERIESSKENLRGFKVEGDIPVEAVYHVLMPSSKNTEPNISVGEISYSSIDIDKIHDLHCTTAKKPQNFVFSDGVHQYKWSSSDSQLFMKFHNTEITLEKWPVSYVKDAFAFFENMGHESVKVTESHSWLLEVKPYSGFNAFMGQSKLARKDGAREKRIQRIKEKYSGDLTETQLTMLVKKLQDLLIPEWKGQEAKLKMITVRKDLISYVKSLGNDDLVQEVQRVAYRPSDELEIRIPNAWQFHHIYPKFFVDAPIFRSNSKKCVSSKKDRTFKLRFLPSGDEIDAYINQENGKAIESAEKQTILGQWILRKVFQLKPYEPVTQDKLNEMGINGIRLTKKSDAIELSFIWIDPDNKPDDYWA